MKKIYSKFEVALCKKGSADPLATAPPASRCEALLAGRHERGRLRKTRKNNIHAGLLRELPEVGGQGAEDLFERGLCLPSGTAMTNSDLDRVTDVIRRINKGQ